jgi:hypothetical protein
MKNFQTEIQSMVLFAKRINFDMNRGIKELSDLWIRDCQKTWAIIEDNKDEAKRIIKSL